MSVLAGGRYNSSFPHNSTLCASHPCRKLKARQKTKQRHGHIVWNCGLWCGVTNAMLFHPAARQRKVLNTAEPWESASLPPIFPCSCSCTTGICSAGKRTFPVEHGGGLGAAPRRVDHVTVAASPVAGAVGKRADTDPGRRSVFRWLLAVRRSQRDGIPRHGAGRLSTGARATPHAPISRPMGQGAQTSAHGLH